MTKKKLRKELKKAQKVIMNLDIQNEELCDQVSSLQEELNSFIEEFKYPSSEIKKHMKGKDITEVNVLLCMTHFLSRHNGVMPRKVLKENVRKMFKKKKRKQLMPYADRNITVFDQVYNNVISHRRQLPSDMDNGFRVDYSYPEFIVLSTEEV